MDGIEGLRPAYYQLHTVSRYMHLLEEDNNFLKII